MNGKSKIVELSEQDVSELAAYIKSHGEEKVRINSQYGGVVRYYADKSEYRGRAN